MFLTTPVPARGHKLPSSPGILQNHIPLITRNYSLTRTFIDPARYYRVGTIELVPQTYPHLGARPRGDVEPPASWPQRKLAAASLMRPGSL